MADSSQHRPSSSHPPSHHPSQEPASRPPSGGPTAPSSSEPLVEPKPDPDAPGTAELAPTVEQDIDMNTGDHPPPETDNMVAPGNPVQDAPVDALAAAAAPSKKETSLREFLGKMDDYAPIVCHLLRPDIHTSPVLSF